MHMLYMLVSVRARGAVASCESACEECHRPSRPPSSESGTQAAAARESGLFAPCWLPSTQHHSQSCMYSWAVNACACCSTFLDRLFKCTGICLQMAAWRASQGPRRYVSLTCPYLCLFALQHPLQLGDTALKTCKINTNERRKEMKELCPNFAAPYPPPSLPSPPPA